jgi:ubiquinone biosynthesis protein
VILTRHLGRLVEIGRIAVSHGWGPLLTRVGLGGILRIKQKTGGRPPGPIELRTALEELGPTFVKFGQLLSTRPDLVPEDYLKELAKLQDTAPTLPLQDIKKVVRAELGDDPARVYASFDEEPLAAASLAQVHAARLADGSDVIVKVQRPDIRAQIDTDIDILFRLAGLLEQVFDRARTYGAVDIVDEFSLVIHEELDYTREGRNTDRLRENMAEVRDVKVPFVHWELTTPRVLTIERIHGCKVSDIDQLVAQGHDLKSVVQKLSAAFLEQVFVDGFFHADPHPGNIFITPEGEIGLIDVGQVGRLDAEAKTGALRLLIAFQHQDTRRFAEEVVTLGIAREEVDIPRLTRDLLRILREYYDMPARSVNIGQILMKTMDVSANHKVRLPTSFAILGKVLANIDGINRQLDPDFNFTEAAEPYINRGARSEFGTKGLITDFYRAAMDLREFVFNLPEQLGELMRRAVAGTLRIEFKHVGLNELTTRLDKVGTRISFSLIVAAIIVGSSLLVLAGEGPIGWFGFPLIGFIGYLVALVFGIYLLIAIITSGKLR